MKISIFIYFLVYISIFGQSNIQYQQITDENSGNVLSIDFTDNNSVLFSLTSPYESGRIVNYTPSVWEEWCLTEMFDTNYYDLCSTIDLDGNYLAIMQNILYRFDGLSWSTLELPIEQYMKYPKMVVDNNNNIWVSVWTYNQCLLKISGDEIIDYTSQILTDGYQIGEVFIHKDTVWICSVDGLAMYYNNEFTHFNMQNSNIPTDIIYSFFVDSKNRRWIGSADKGLIQWVDDSTFVAYNDENSGLTNSFINDISEDSKGKIWIATDDGFAFWENNIITKITGIAENWTIPVINVDKEDRVWFGTYGQGLYVCNDTNSVKITGIKIETDIPFAIKVYPNYPNPFNPSTKITYETSTSNNITIKIFNALGEEIKTLLSEFKQAGKYEIEFDGNKLPSGVYFCSLQSGNQFQYIKMNLVK